MIEQAGVYRFTLYEAKDLVVSYNVDSTIRTITNSGEVLEVENSDCTTFDLGFNFEHKRSGNNKLLYKNTLLWKQLGLNGDNLDLISQLKESIYGWVPVIEFYNLSKKIITNPFLFSTASIDNNVSNHYNIELKNVIFGNRIIDYAPISDQQITADSNTVTADSSAVDASGGTI